MKTYTLETMHPFDASPARTLVAVGDAADTTIYGPPTNSALEPGYYLLSADQSLTPYGPVGPFGAPWSALRWASRTLAALYSDSWGVACRAGVTPGVRWDW